MPLRAYAIDWGRNRILRVDKNSDPILSSLRTKVSEILGRCSLYFAGLLCASLSLMSTSCFVHKIIAIEVSKSSKTEQIGNGIKSGGLKWQCIVNLKGGNYSDVLPLKAARRDNISNLTSFGASNLSWRRTQCRFI